ncbi:Nitrilotriacetate monooxygenase component A [Methylobacterium crusticola]|uniref:Nitrilotriacetate monooxygenase component A n=1 Tax=Methylobacterium crusticola TaxID=1697972 RepID=A0ABQ4RAH9_9HYPH|nr:LLM class flavin-dependent oxidoreductase [Methylobacterium crusticola]GJD53707.1 Nitrilotriacetate monooxygenase component A [Methylobacterium crusticola]
MSATLHLAGFLSAGPVVHSHALWRNPQHPTDFLSAAHYAEIGRVLERGRFDLLFFADRLALADRFGNDRETGLRLGDQDATRLDPLPVLAVIAAATRHIGLGATRSTTYEHPYHVARAFRTLDHLSGGRAAWNVVTSLNDGEALNFGFDAHMDHGARYDRADEFLEVATKLWDSWDPDALVLDRGRGIYADPAKVRSIDHVGRYFRSRGPLNIPASPQGRPVIIQAGASGRGRHFAARWAEVVFCLAPDPAAMAAFTASIREGVAAAGRPPGSCKVLAAVMPFVGRTRSEAEDRRDAHNALVDPRVGLSTLSAHLNLDLSGLPLDRPIERLAGTGTQGNLAHVLRISAEEDLTLAQIGQIYGQSVMVPQLCGTGREIADEIVAIFRAGACDGFIISPAFLPDSFVDFVDHVVPALQEGGWVRRHYEGQTLRDRLRSEPAGPAGTRHAPAHAAP